MANDIFGILKLNDTKSGGREWFSNWHTAPSHNWSSSGISSQNRDPQDDEADLHCNSGQGNKATTTNATGILKAEGGNWRLYINDPDGVLKWQNVEMTIYYRALSDNSSGGIHVRCRLAARTEHQLEFQCKGSGHTAGAFELKANGVVQLRKEMLHDAYSNDVISDTTTTPALNVWTGVKLVVKNVGNTTIVQGWLDTTDGAGGGTWNKILEKVDGGNWAMTDSDDVKTYNGAGSGSGLCTKITPKEARLPDPASSCYLRMDNTTVEFKKFSIREITGEGGTDSSTGGGSTPPIPSGTSPQKLNEYGHPNFYPSKQGGFSMTLGNNPKSNKYFDWPDEMSFPSDDIVKMAPSGPTDFGMGKNISGFGSTNSIGGCNMDFEARAADGYCYKKDDVRDLEYKMLVKVNNIGDHGLSFGGPTGRHSNDGCCSGFAYMLTMETGTNPAKFAFRKEMFHVNYDDSPEGDWEHPLANFKIAGHGWVGCGFVRYNRKVAGKESPAEDDVVLEFWFNPNPEAHPLDWTMLRRIVDRPGNGWGDGGNKCNGAKDQHGPWSNAQNRVKTNSTSGSIEFKAISFREIDPTAQFPTEPGGGGPPGGEPEPPPTTGTAFKDWTIKYNLITFPENSCSTGTTEELFKFYDVLDNASSSHLHFQRYRVCMVANGSASRFIGKTPKRVVAWLDKTGTPPTGDVTCVLRKASDDSVAVTFTWTGGPNLDAAANLTTSKTQYTFENLTSNYVWQNGDRLCIEYSGNTENMDNQVNVYRNTNNPYDGTASCAVKFDAFSTGAPPPDGYSAADTTRDYAWEIWE